MTELKNIVAAINRIAPEELQESWDNCGIQVNDAEDKAISKILTCLEISDSVIDEAVEKGADMIVTHHPLIFSAMRSVQPAGVVGKQVVELIKRGITVYSSHTAFDSALHGTNQDLAEKLGLTEIAPLVADAAHEGCGMGRTGEYAEPVPFDEFMSRMASVCGAAGLRAAGRAPLAVKKAALCTGAGSEFIDMAAAGGADVYITGDLKYHDARHADDIGFCVIDGGHYGTEVLFAENMAALLAAELGDSVEIAVSETDINPFFKA